MTSLALDIGVHVFVTRAQKFPKINSAITARLTNAEQNKIILNSSLVTPTSKHASKRGKGFNAMLRGVVIPRDIIIIQKRKKLLSIFFKSLLIAGADFRLKIGPCQPTVKSANRPFVFFHETTPESVPINGFNDWFNQRAKTFDHRFKFFVEWFPQEVVV